MPDRTTRTQVAAVFGLLCDATGYRPARRYDDHGAWTLDYNATYGGYVIEQIDDVSSGVSQPFGARRRPATEMASAMRFAIDALAARQRAANTKENTP